MSVPRPQICHISLGPQRFSGQTFYRYYLDSPSRISNTEGIGMALVLKDPDKVLPSEAGRLLGLSSQRVVQLVDAGRLPARRVLGIRIIPRAAVLEMAAERARRAAIEDDRAEHPGTQRYAADRA